MKIDLPALKKIAKATPELSIAQLVGVLVAVVEVERDQIERDRIATKRQHDATTANNDQQPPTRDQQESALFAFARQVCGKNSGGMCTALLKQHGFDIETVKAIYVRAQQTDDAKAFVAGTIRRQGNGKQPGYVAEAGDRVVARAEAGERGAGARDIVDLAVDRGEGGDGAYRPMAPRQAG